MVLAATLMLGAAQGNFSKLVPPLAWTLCLAAQLRPDRLSAIAAPLRWRSMQWLGAISYPIYLANEPIQKALAFALIWIAPGNALAFDLVWLPAAVGLPIGAAAWLHRYVETPAHRWGRSLVQQSASHAAAPATGRQMSGRLNYDNAGTLGE